jgi:hypothetical protein
MTRRPNKPWLVTLTGHDYTDHFDHTSEKAAYRFLLAALRSGGPAIAARVDQWEGGRWWHFETVEAADLPPLT